ncbi:MAG: glycosyltransferase family 4 protein [Bacteroidales bacterium]|nr:glycosyltransferase family 4 protein [Bacteroidales bacterium]
MKIGFILPHSGKNSSGGVLTYSIAVLKLLLRSQEIKSIYLIHSPGQEEHITNYFKNEKVIPIEFDRKKLSFRIFNKLSRCFYPNRRKNRLFKKISLKLNPYKRKFDALNLDVLHVPFQTSPIYGIKTPVIITMHDVQELHFPEYFSSDIRMYRAIHYKKAIDESDHIIVSFNHVKQDLLKYFEINADKVTVCPITVAEDWFSKTNYTSFEQLKEKYTLPDMFILYPAATWQHKNHTNLIKAISILRIEGKDVFLVCTGGKTSFYKKIENEIMSLKLENNVKFMGTVPEEDLIGLYHSAQLVVIPTLYEAGSGPLFEAMRYGVPVICSTITSLPESIGNDEFIFNPSNPEEIADLIKKGCFGNDFRKRNIENSKRRMEFYKNQNYIEPFIDAYKKAIKAKESGSSHN